MKQVVGRVNRDSASMERTLEILQKISEPPGVASCDQKEQELYR